MDYFYISKKAFDKVSRGKLLVKLEFIGLAYYVVKWGEAYLKNRKQFVVIDGSAFDLLSVKCSVPQGSVATALFDLHK